MPGENTELQRNKIHTSILLYEKWDVLVLLYASKTTDLIFIDNTVIIVSVFLLGLLYFLPAQLSPRHDRAQMFESSCQVNYTSI